MIHNLNLCQSNPFHLGNSGLHAEDSFLGNFLRDVKKNITDLLFSWQQLVHHVYHHRTREEIKWFHVCTSWGTKVKLSNLQDAERIIFRHLKVYKVSMKYTKLRLPMDVMHFFLHIWLCVGS